MKKDYFHLDQVNHQELFCLLLAHFSTMEGLRFQKPGSSHYLEITIGEDDEIKSIQASKRFPRMELMEIEREVLDNLLADHGTKVRQIVCFCHSEVLGYFKYKDLFQILPIFDEAPKPLVGFADQPFILEVSYKYCPIPMVDLCRWKEKEVIYTRLLNLLLYQMISSGSRFTRFDWVLKVDNTHSEWMQLGYAAPNLKEVSEDFSPVESINPIEQKAYPEYYITPRFRTSTPLAIPDNLEYSLDTALSLSPPLWRKFYIACSWFAQYHFTVRESTSSAYIALVTSLESLVKDIEPDTCTTCGQPRFRVMKRFRDLINTYFPIIDQFPNEKKLLYNVRSQLAHGTDLLQADLEPWKFFLDAKKNRQEAL